MGLSHKYFQAVMVVRQAATQRLHFCGLYTTCIYACNTSTYHTDICYIFTLGISKICLSTPFLFHACSTAYMEPFYTYNYRVPPCILFLHDNQYIRKYLTFHNLCRRKMISVTSTPPSMKIKFPYAYYGK